ncbi:ATP-binding protein [Streptomyces fuscichromogenes]|uniref:ATP-binding protein n=1 Tax=Streptomyces fuscichromogenes TaxID=1324013 RepID=UPI00382715CC
MRLVSLPHRGPPVKPTRTPPSPSPAGRARHRPVRGRVEECAVLGARFDALAQGRGGVVRVQGPPGSGKTRLLSEACSMAALRGLNVFRGGADPDSQFVPLAPLLEGTRNEGRPLFDTVGLRALATAPEQRFWLLQELQDQLERAALDRPLAVVLDDVQWCDDLTLLALRTLSSRLSAHAILWLVAVRGGSGTPEVLTTLDRLDRNGALQVSLGPLSDAAVSEITQDVLGAPPDPATLDVVRRAEGVPLLLVELLHGMTAEGRVVVKDGAARLAGHRLPARFQTSIRQRLHGLSEPTREVVRAASAIGHAVTVDLLAELLDRPVGALVAPVQEALDSDLFTEREGRLVFRHDLIREAVADSLPESVRKALRRHAAEIVLARGASLSEAASLVMDSAEPGDQAAVQLLRAAAAELSETAPSAAAELSRQALDLTAEQAPERPMITAETMVLLWRAGRATQARALGATAVPGTLPCEAEARVRLSLARVSSQYDFTEGARQAGLGAALPGIPECLRAHLLALHCLDLGLVGDFGATARAAVDKALRSARQVGDSAALATAMTAHSVVLYYQCDWTRALQRADEAEDIASEAGFSRSLWVPEALWKAFMLNAAGRTAEALAASEAGVRDTRRQGQAAAMRLWVMNRCRVLLDAGRLYDARAEAEAGAAMADELGMGNFADATLLYTLFRVALHTGDRDAVKAYAAEVGRMVGDPAVLVRNAGSWLLALMADAEGRSEQAMALLDESFATFEQPGPSLASPDDPADLPVFVRMALRAGAHDRAAAAVALAEHRAARNPGFPILAAAAAHARGLRDNDTAHLLHAVDLYDGIERLLPPASALEDAGRKLAVAHPTDAVPVLGAALDRYLEAGAEHDAARVRRRLRALGAPRRRTGATETVTAWPELTASEVAVVRLVARGMTNRQVAEHLENSPHTVSSHLRHAFLKLGLTSRAELARLAREREHTE